MAGRIALLATVAGIFTILYLAGFFELIREPEQVRAALLELGIWAPILYVVAFSLLEPFFVPGFAFMIPGAVIWSYPELFALSWLGSIGAGITGFSFARYLGREFVEHRLPARFRDYDERLARNGLRTVILVRLTLFLTPPAHWLLGLSKVRFGPFVLGTAIGFVPGIALLTYLVVFVGESIGDWLASQPRQVWIALAVGVALLIGVRRRRKARREARAAALGEVRDAPDATAAGSDGSASDRGSSDAASR